MGFFDWPFNSSTHDNQQQRSGQSHQQCISARQVTQTPQGLGLFLKAAVSIQMLDF